MSVTECPQCGESLARDEIEEGLALVCSECDEPDPDLRGRDRFGEPPDTPHWVDPPAEVTRRRGDAS